MLVEILKLGLVKIFKFKFYQNTDDVEIWKLRFGQKANLLLRLWAQGLVKILNLKFRQDLKLELGQFFLLMFCRMLNPSWILVEILKLGLVKILKLKFYGEADV